MSKRIKIEEPQGEKLVFKQSEPCCDDMKIIKKPIQQGPTKMNGSRVMGNYRTIKICKNCGEQR